ncbi:hypothetical protein EDD36DRAFT_74469 [Exophiala viscosa]|uniref:Uncharacterized protein n=1 Tax=Exophiala viscosa TaxID=2486360 RepID=A0AAN6DN82_9EURO|nr:hypothetical protein EDD36DRAFT_74469 [Exophiala viscosa]
MAALSAVWELSRTTNNLIGISTGILQAATTDSVQPLALDACMKFGTTLPMSQNTRSNVEALCSAGHQNQVIEHLKIAVGDLKGDCGWQLCQNDAGLRFLGLAACLLTFDRWSAAQTLQELIIATAATTADRLLVPTARQFQDVLTSLQSRLGRSDFGKNVVGLEVFVARARKSSTYPHHVPSGATIKKLVEALSSLQRIGDERRHSLQIEVVHEESAWVIALVEWLLGEPPIVEYGGWSGPQGGPQVTVIPCDMEDDDSEDRLRITVRDQFDSILELVTAGATAHDFLGLIPVTMLGNTFVQRFGPRGSHLWLLAIEMISYGCSAVLKTVHKAKSDDINNSLDALPHGTTVKTSITYPLENEVLETMAHLLGLEPAVALKHQPPVRSMHWEALQQLGQGSESFRTLTLGAKKCIATIFTLSLFVLHGSPDPLFVVYDRGLTEWSSTCFPDQRLWAFLEDTIPVLIVDEEGFKQEKAITQSFDLSPFDLFRSALRLLGHDVDVPTPYQSGRPSETLAISSFSGQTVFPDVLHSLDLQPESRVRLFYLHGNILWKRTSTIR